MPICETTVENEMVVRIWEKKQLTADLVEQQPLPYCDCSCRSWDPRQLQPPRSIPMKGISSTSTTRSSHASTAHTATKNALLEGVSTERGATIVSWNSALGHNFLRAQFFYSTCDSSFHLNQYSHTTQVTTNFGGKLERLSPLAFRLVLVFCLAVLTTSEEQGKTWRPRLSNRIRQSRQT